MDREIEVLKQLEVKNKEIFLKKLEMDLENNKVGLILAISNMLSKTKEDVIFKIIEIEETISNKGNIERTVGMFIDSFSSFIFELIDSKEQKLREKLVDFIPFELIKGQVLAETDFLKKKLSDRYFNEISNLLDSLIKESLNENDFYRMRIEEYLKNLLYNNLLSSIFLLITDRDNILINNFKESYMKYQQLNDSTIK